jgi:hypothetical protein
MIPRSSAGVAVALLLLAAPAAAEETSAARRAMDAKEHDRAHALAELSAGMLALPAAEVCLKSLTDCSRGELSVAVGIDFLYRFRSFGIGAGIEWATTVRNDAAQGAAELNRHHSRSYFLVEAQARWYFVRVKAWEFWAGGAAGGVVINDSWSVEADRKPYADTAFIGPRAATVGTEGLTVGVGLGAEWSFGQNWSLGTKLRYSNWVLPFTRKMSPTGDVASLSGRIDMIDVGLVIAYRIAL